MNGEIRFGAFWSILRLRENGEVGQGVRRERFVGTVVHNERCCRRLIISRESCGERSFGLTPSSSIDSLTAADPLAKSFELNVSETSSANTLFSVFCRVGPYHKLSRVWNNETNHLPKRRILIPLSPPSDITRTD